MFRLVEVLVGAAYQRSFPVTRWRIEGSFSSKSRVKDAVGMDIMAAWASEPESRTRLAYW